MFIATFTELDGSSAGAYGPFKSDFAAKDWAFELMELGLKPESMVTILEIEEPVELGFDPGL